MSSGQGVDFLNGLVLRVAEEMKATDSFDGYDFVFLERMADVSELIGIVREIERFSVFVEGDFRSTDRTGDRLGMETSVGRICIFFLAVGAHREVAHRRGRAIIGIRFRYGEARSTESAGEEKITASPVFQIGEFREAVVAEEEIRRDFGVSASRTIKDSESRHLSVDSFLSYRVDAHVIRKSGQDLFERFRIIDYCFDSVARVPY